MSQAQAAAGLDRLPWLPDEPRPQPQRKRRGGGNRDMLLWALAGMLLVAALSYWMGARSWQRQSSQSEAQPPATTVPMPQPRAAEPQERQPQVVLEPAPEVTPPAAREVPIASPRVQKRRVQSRAGTLTRESPPTEALETTIAEQKGGAQPAKAAAASPPKPAANADSRPLTVWPASKSAGAKGRIVRIGAFGSRQQAKLGWRYMVRSYPAVAHLKATVVADRNSRGRRFYRFQIGTTSQAHSEVLCQRMEKLHLSCAVVGLPWDPKGVER
jgi:outer membrane biosynthesis protein TonB